jgi:TonB family protein
VAARAARVEDRRWLQILDTVADRYGLTRDIVVSRTDSADLLATWGIRRPQVLLPDHSLDWTLDRVHVVLCHELAHIRRHDWLVQMLAETLRALLWFNPLAWMVCTRLRRESEQACDDEVLGIGVGGRDYAAHLLELARRCRLPGSTWASAMPMAHPSTLERRIAAMLNPRLDRQAPSWPAIATLSVVLLLVTLPIAVLRAGQAGPAPLSGTIYDVTGGVMPGVEVTLVDANQMRWAVTSNASGRFELPPVGAGRYVLEATLAGFRALRQEFELRDARDWDRAFTLQVGAVQETIRIRTSRAALPKQLKASGAAAQPVRVGGNIRAPRKVKDVRPIYPAAMREAGLTGLVPLEAVIGRDGTVSSVRVLSAQVHPDFAIAAVDAVRQWLFTPTLLNGEPVEVVMTVSVQFDLEG